MIILFFSLSLGWIGFYLGSKTGVDFYVILFSVAGFFLPPFYVLERIWVNQDEKPKKK
ncbi:hypothetical protein [Clostridium culturomicium]|uniref:hypothetical protein n=1 Tax=Clostridium culturomicium TaxID=1499683 RepID=UPI000A76A125|nr:hypothetical protein [Clostridium culturomicium]